MFVLLPLVLAPALPWPQETPRPDGRLRTEAELQSEGWALLDGVVAQAGEGIVTLGGLEEFLVERLGPETDEARARELAPRALTTLETIELETEAGEDLGISREEVDRIVRANLDSRRRNQGVRSYLAYLEEEGLDPLSASDTQSRSLYRVLWTRETLGLPAGGRRIRRDAFLRPGTLRAFYRENKDVIGEPAEVRFQRITIAPRPPDGLETARLVAEEIIARLGEGEQFQDLLLEESDEDPVQSLEPWQPVPALAQRDQDLAAFALRAPEGSIYPEPLPAFPAPGPDGRRPPQQAWFVYRLNDRVSEPPPPFEARETQRMIRELLEERWQKSVLDRERERLQASSYRWRHPRFGGTELER